MKPEFLCKAFCDTFNFQSQHLNEGSYDFKIQDIMIGTQKYYGFFHKFFCMILAGKERQVSCGRLSAKFRFRLSNL